MDKNQSTLGMGGIAEKSGSGFEALRKLVLATSAALLISIHPLASVGEPVNINLVSAEAISKLLSGVGLAKANWIMENREAYGPFERVDELAVVRGIGPATVEENCDAILLRL